LLRLSNNHQWLDKKRESILTIQIDGESIDIRDQQPLYAGKTRLEGGWTFADLVKQLNNRIFFWPGWFHGAISHGQRHFKRYESQRPAILRVKTADIFAINDTPPLFCKYNSGSPRTTQGKGSPRGPKTFLPCNQAAYVASNVVEVTYVGQVNLPSHIEVADHPTWPWKIRK
jgi:hypothetical protein